MAIHFVKKKTAQKTIGKLEKKNESKIQRVSVSSYLILTIAYKPVVNFEGISSATNRQGPCILGLEFAALDDSGNVWRIHLELEVFVYSDLA